MTALAQAERSRDGDTSPPGPASALRFWHGVLALPEGARFIAARPASWPAASVPCLILLLLAVPIAWWAIGDFGPWLSQWLLPETSSWYGQGAHIAVRWLGSALAAYLGLWLSLLVSPTLSAPALEHLVRVQEAALGAPERPRRGFLFELRCGLEAQLGALAISLPLWVVYWTLSALLPGAVLLLLPLQALPLALSLAWNLLDYPLTLRGVRARQRFALLRQRPGPILGFGLCFAALAWIPGVALLLLPAGVVGATRLAWRLLPDSAA